MPPQALLSVLAILVDEAPDALVTADRILQLVPRPPQTRSSDHDTSDLLTTEDATAGANASTDSSAASPRGKGGNPDGSRGSGCSDGARSPEAGGKGGPVTGTDAAAEGGRCVDGASEVRVDVLGAMVTGRLAAALLTAMEGSHWIGGLGVLVRAFGGS